MLTRRDILLCLVVMAVVLATGCSFHYHEPPQAGQESVQDNIDWEKYLDLAAQWTMAVGAFLLFWLTRKTLTHAEKTAADALSASKNALDETKRSVDAFVEAERGRLFLVITEIEEDSTLCEYAFKNIGHGPLTVVRFGFTSLPFPVTGDVPYPQSVASELTFNHPLMKGEYLSSTVWEGEIPQSHMVNYGNVIPEVHRDLLNAKTRRLLVQFDIVYKTLGSLYKMRETQVFTRLDERMIRVVIGGDGAQHDRRRDNQSTPARIHGLRKGLFAADQIARENPENG